MALPSNVDFGTVTGVTLRTSDGAPVGGVKFTFTPSLTPALVKVVGSVPPVLVRVDAVVVQTNDSGVLCRADGTPGVLLPSSSDADLAPSGWTWVVSTEKTNNWPKTSATFVLTPNETVDLTGIVNVSPSLGVEIAAWTAVVDQAEAARDAAVVAKNAAEAVPTTTDGLMTTIDGNAASTYRVQADARQSNTIGLVSGLVDDDTTDNRAALQAALDRGGRVILPPTAGRYLINGDLDITVPGTQVQAWGAPIRQGTNGQSLFDVAVADVTINGVDAVGMSGPLDVTGMFATPWQMSVIASRWTVVNAKSGADRLSIPWIRGRGFDSVVRVTDWDDTLGASSVNVADVNVGTILCSNVEFGLVVQGTSRFRYDSVRGSYVCPIGGTRPPHLVYFSGSGSDNTDLTGGAGVATSFEGGAVTGQAFQFKGVNRGQVASLIATGCPGAVNIMDCHDLTIDSIESTADTITGTYGSISFDQTVEQQRVSIGRAHLQLVNDVIACRVINGDRTRIGELIIETNHTTSGGTTAYDVQLGGTNSELGFVNVRNTGTNSWRAIGLWAGAGHRVDRMRLERVRVGLEVRATATSAVIGYNPDDITLHPTDGYVKLIVTNGAGPTLTRPGKPPTSSRTKALDPFTSMNETTGALAPAITGQAWTTGIGTWVVDPALAEVGETANTAHANTYLDSGIANVEARASIKLTGFPGLLLRRVAVTEYLCVYLSTTGVVIAKRDTTLTTLQAGPAVTYQAGRWYDLRVQIFGTRIDVFVDNVFSVSHTLAAGDATKFLTQTVHGLFSSASAGASKFKDFEIRQL